MKYQNILVEGTDRSGKSTLVQRLSDTLGLDNIKLRHQPGDQYQRYLGLYTLAERAVFDRGHISEELYGPIYGRNPSFTHRQQEKLDLIVNEHFLVIFCLPDLAEAQQRLDIQINDGEDVIRPNDLETSWRAFQKARDRFPNHLLHTSGPWEHLDALVQQVATLFGPREPLYPT